MKHKLYPALIACSCLILLYIAIRPVFSPFLPGSADGFAHKYRLVNFDESLSRGILRPRWTQNAVLGYGAPLYIFNYSVPYYIVDALYRMGYSIQTASQLYAALTMILSAITMYLLVSLLWGTWAGVLAATTYMFAPYHLHTLYSYEAWGEMLAFTYPPLLLYLLISLFRIPADNRVRRKLYFASIVIIWVLFILTHNISTYITSPIIGVLALIYAKHTRNTYVTLGKIAGLVALISCFFTLPAITQTNTIKISILMVKEFEMRRSYMIPLIDQIRTNWAALTGPPVIYQAFTIGIPILITLFAGICFIIANRIMHIRHKHVAVIPLFVYALFGILILSLMFVDPVSYTLYIFKPLRYVLYPYRFLFLATFTGSILTGYLYRKSIPTGICIVILTVLFGYPFAHPGIDVFSFPPSFFQQPQMLGYAIPTLKTMGIAEFLPQTASIDFLVSEEKAYREYGVLPQKFIIPNGSGTIISQSVKPESLSVRINANSEAPLTVSTLYYPNWRATLDGKHIPVSHDREGRITLTVPRGIHSIQLTFGYSTIELVGICFSLLGIVLFAVSLLV